MSFAVILWEDLRVSTEELQAVKKGLTWLWQNVEIPAGDVRTDFEFVSLGVCEAVYAREQNKSPQDFSFELTDIAPSADDPRDKLTPEEYHWGAIQVDAISSIERLIEIVEAISADLSYAEFEPELDECLAWWSQVCKAMKKKHEEYRQKN